MKIFISQPMNGLSEEEIEVRKNNAIFTLAYQRYIRKMMYFDNDDYTEPDEFINSYIKDAPEGYTDIEYISDSIRLIKDADFIIFAHGWQNSKACQIEYEVWKAYKDPKQMWFEN
jgi:hypothetical protein